MMRTDSVSTQAKSLFIFLIVFLLSVTQIGVFSAQAANSDADSSALLTLSFDLKRPQFSVMENSTYAYSSYYAQQPDGGGVVVPGTSTLKDFAVIYELSGSAIETPVSREIRYSAENFGWDNNGATSFSNIPVAHKDITIEYYAPEGETFFEPHLLKYELFLEERPQATVLRVPRLRPNLVDEPEGNEEVLKIANVNVKEKAVYLDGVKGADSNDGQTSATPVASFERAKELAGTDQDIKVIYVSGTVPVEGSVDLKGTSAKLVRAENFAGYLLRVPVGKEAFFQDITVDGSGDEPIGKQSLLSVSGTAHIENGAIFQNNKIQAKPNTRTYGGAIYVRGTSNKPASLVMSGGIIRNNQAIEGGGIYLARGHMNFTGGVVEHNTAKYLYDSDVRQKYASGGGILADEGSHIEMSGDALVRENRSDEVGGGISLGSRDWTNVSIKLTMTGGTLDGNTAGTNGGGLFIQAGAYSATHVATITGGKIINNRMTGDGKTEMLFGGGGIYVNGIKDGYGGLKWNHGQLNLFDAVISNNTSKYEGAGLAACPISHTDINLSRTVAIYGNTSEGNSRFSRGAKEKVNDVFFYSSLYLGLHAGKAEYKLADKMLGGVPYDWRDASTGEPLASDKYAGPLNYVAGGGQAYLGLNTEAKASARTHQLAKVLISGNYSATRGGGIGSNGSQAFGDDEPIIDIPVKKLWDDAENQDGKRPEKVTVTLVADEVPTDYSLELNASNNWTDKFVYLPKFKKVTGDDGSEKQVEIVYSVKETSVDAYTPNFTGDAETGLTVTNKHIPELTTLTVQKKWIDHDGTALSADLPESIELQLVTVSGEERSNVGTPVLVKPTTQGEWVYTFENLPVYSKGKKLTYSVVETPVAGFTNSVTVDKDGVVLVTNTKEVPPPPPTPPTPPVVPPTPPVVPPTPPVVPPTPPVVVNPPQLPNTGTNSRTLVAASGALIGIGVSTWLLRKSTSKKRHNQ